MFLFDTGKRKSNEQFTAVVVKLTVSFVLSVALIAYGIYMLYLIFLDGDQYSGNGFALRSFIQTPNTVTVPDVVFCTGNSSFSMTYHCNAVFANGSVQNDGCTSFIDPQPKPYLDGNNNQTTYCTRFTASNQIVYSQWGDNDHGLKSIVFTITAGQVAPAFITAQLFFPGYDVYTLDMVTSRFEDDVTIQAAREQNKYFLYNAIQMFTIFSITEHDVLSRSDSLSVLGSSKSGLTPQFYLYSSSEKVPLTNAAGVYAQINLEPATYNLLRQSDQRQFTIIFVLGAIGGMFSTLFGVYVFLFGSQRLNPLGIIIRLFPSALQYNNSEPTTSSLIQGTPEAYDKSADGRRSIDGSEQVYASKHRSDQPQPGVLIETAKNLTLEQRVIRIEKLLGDFVINADQLGDKSLSHYSSL